MTPKRKRLYVFSSILLGLGAAVALVLVAFEDTIVFFYSPTDLTEKPIAPGRAFRLGGMVEEGSVDRGSGSATIRFKVTDYAHAVDVTYTGMLPDLFREGQGVVAQGSLDDQGIFVAKEVLAKHDENYMPPEVAEALEEGKAWKEQTGRSLDGGGGVSGPAAQPSM